MRQSGDVFSWSSGNDKARYNVYTTAGYSGSNVNKNHGQIAQRGYMMDPKDWRDIEMTAYVNIQANGDDQFVMYARGGTHTGSGNCEGFAYKSDLYFSGGTRFAKEQYHVAYDFTNKKSGSGSIEGRWVGMKTVFYNSGANAVTLELWLDLNNNQNWTKVDSYVDSGGWGSSGGKCGGSKDQVGVWGGPNATYRWDNASSVQIKWASVREISKDGAFNEGGSNSGGSGNANSPNPYGDGSGNPYGGGSGGGGTGSTGTGGSGTGSTGGADDDSGSQTTVTVAEPPPIITMSKDWSFLLNVGVDVQDNCTAGNPLEVSEPVSIWNVAGETLIHQDIGYTSGLGVSQVGLYIANVNSAVYDGVVKRVKVNALKRTVDGELNSPEGLVYCRIYSLIDGQMKAQIGGGQNVSGIDVNEQFLIFEQTDNKHQCKVGDVIVLEYLDASAASNKCLKVKHTTKDVLDSINTFMIVKKSTGYDLTSHKDKDIGFEIWIAPKKTL